LEQLKDWGRKVTTFSLIQKQASASGVFQIDLLIEATISSVNELRCSRTSLVRLTWQRNAHIDIVEFVINEEGELIGRALHPSDGLTFKEFLYCAYTLAVATDRLEYLIDSEDLN